MPYVEWTQDMGEISGFGGGYEAACRAMVKAGVEWLESHADKQPRYRQYENITGICEDDNEHAKELDAVIIKAAGGNATGAMHQYAMRHILAFRKIGAEEYCRQLRERTSEESKL